MNLRNVGKYGESIVVNFLISHEYKILYTNWFCYGGELDIVALSFQNKLVFVEVKYVSNSNFCLPEYLFTKTKIFHLKRTISQFFLKHREFYKYEWQLDLITICGLVINHHKDVTAELELGLALEFHT